MSGAVSGAVSAAVCVIVRDEAPYLLEWLAWQRLIGFDRILAYDNGSSDEGPGMLAALDRAGVLSHVPWPDQPGTAPQLTAYADALGRAGTGWIAFLDIDEFLVLLRHASVGEFLAAFPARVSAIAVNQVVFGSGGQGGPDGRLVTERFIHRGPDELYYHRWVKSIVRPAEVAQAGVHVCRMRTGMYADPGGGRARLLEEDRFRIHRGTAQVNHYILKSRTEFGRKRDRLRCADAVPGGAPARDRYTQAFFDAHDRNDVEDLSAAARSPALHREIAWLRTMLAG